MQELERMKFKQFIFVFCFFLMSSPLLGVSKEEKRAKSADAISEYDLKKETRPVCSEDIPISKNKLLIIWNTLFPTSQIEGQTTDDEVTFRNIIIPYGEQATIESVLIAVSKFLRKVKRDFIALKMSLKALLKKTEKMHVFMKL